MRILNWNLHNTNGIGAERQHAIIGAIESLEPDVLLLQEVPIAGRFRDRLMTEGFTLTEPGHNAPGLWKLPYASIVASRLPMEQVDAPIGLRFPSLVAAARIAGKEFASVHIPNASGFNKWARQYGHERDIKVTHLEMVLGWLMASDRRLVAGDFNEPDYFRSGKSISFSATRASDRKRQSGIVDGLLNSNELHHVCRDLHDPNDEPSYWIRSAPHPLRKGWFDHVVTSGGMQGWSAKYVHHLRSERNTDGKEKYSDHSPLLILDTPAAEYPLIPSNSLQYRSWPLQRCRRHNVILE